MKKQTFKSTKQLRLSIPLFHNSSYIQYSQIAARVVRKSLKPEPRAAADKRGDGLIKMKKWINGKPEGECKFIPTSSDLALNPNQLIAAEM